MHNDVHGLSCAHKTMTCPSLESRPGISANVMKRNSTVPGGRLRCHDADKKQRIIHLVEHMEAVALGS